MKPISSRLDAEKAKKNFNEDLRNCFQVILDPISNVGKSYLNMVTDPIIMTYVFANTLVYIGFAVPYVYTVVSNSQAEFLARRLRKYYSRIAPHAWESIGARQASSFRSWGLAVYLAKLSSATYQTDRASTGCIFTICALSFVGQVSHNVISANVEL